MCGCFFAFVQMSGSSMGDIYLREAHRIWNGGRDDSITILILLARAEVAYYATSRALGMSRAYEPVGARAVRLFREAIDSPIFMRIDPPTKKI